MGKNLLLIREMQLQDQDNFTNALTAAGSMLPSL